MQRTGTAEVVAANPTLPVRGTTLSSAESGLTSSPLPQALRPVQYLGNKLRSLPTILNAVEQLGIEPSRAVDLFTGTSVVAQGLASRGWRVTAVDTSCAAAAMAGATLGAGRPASVDANRLVRIVHESSAPHQELLEDAYSRWLAIEDAAVACGDGNRLLELGKTIPTVWGGLPHGSLGRIFGDWRQASAENAPCVALISAVMAGSYLGVRQTIETDARRMAIRDMYARGEVDAWHRDLLITSLLAAVSAAAFTPGKHFAQPHRLTSTKDLSFHASRAVTDRTISVERLSSEWVQRIVDHGRLGSEMHSVWHTSAEQLTVDALANEQIGLVYADPPYTAQQYSRFYHALDTIVRGTAQPLQVVRGQVTGGLYPEKRYLSPYCSKQRASSAFKHLASICRGAGATLLLSYSNSAPGSTGNARMITLTELRAVVENVYGASNVSVSALAHDYRQFNDARHARTTRSDQEVLVIARAA